LKEYLELLYKQIFDNSPVLLHDIKIPTDLRVVVLAPHPDDFDAVAVTMKRLHENGNRIDVGVLTSAASGVEDGFDGAFTNAEKAATRECEQRESCRFFGLPDECLRFLYMTEGDDGHMIDELTNINLMRRYLLDIKPDIVFMPHGNDTNLDHQRTFLFYQRIIEQERLSIMAWLIRDPKTIEMRDDIYTVFDTVEADWKGEMLRCHHSQHQRNLNTRGHGFDDRILMVNRDIAKRIGSDFPFAEAFEVLL